jgi:phosphodiesterase/alkaline phosphatase D-like protein
VEGDYIRLGNKALLKPIYFYTPVNNTLTPSVQFEVYNSGVEYLGTTFGVQAGTGTETFLIDQYRFRATVQTINYTDQGWSAKITFKTIKRADLTISNVKVSKTGYSNKNLGYAVIEWDTDVPATSKVYHCTTTTCTTQQSVEDNNYVYHHQVTVKELTAKKKYYYRITSVNRVDDKSYYPSATKWSNFTTPKAVTLSLSSIAVTKITSASAVVSWKTNQAATSQVDYGLTSSLGQKANDGSFVTDHEITLKDLQPGSSYYYSVFALDEEGDEQTSSLFSFSTPALVISKVKTQNLGSSLVISWRTDQDSSSQVDYGLTGSLGQTLAYSELTRQHEITLAHLTPNQIYYYQITSHDAQGRAVQSQVYKITTAPLTVFSVPTVSHLTSDSATISWTTDRAVTSQLDYGSTADELDVVLKNDKKYRAKHSLKLSQLVPGQIYYYHCSGMDETKIVAASPVYSFTTLTSTNPDITSTEDKAWQQKFLERLKKVGYSPQEAEKNFVKNEMKLVSGTDSNLVNRLLGRILLQVENKGEAWYLDKDSYKRYYLRDGQTAYAVMWAVGLGINDSDLVKIPIGDIGGDSSEAAATTVDPSLVSRLKGRILLQVQQHGEAWYVNPADGQRYYLKDGDTAYQIMRYLSLGIKNSDLQKIPVGELE